MGDLKHINQSFWKV